MKMPADAFLTAVYRAKADDAPRLVLADWLDENGHEYGALLREKEPRRVGGELFWHLARVSWLTTEWSVPAEVFDRLRPVPTGSEAEAFDRRVRYLARWTAMADLTRAVCLAAGVIEELPARMEAAG